MKTSAFFLCLAAFAASLLFCLKAPAQTPRPELSYVIRPALDSGASALRIELLFLGSASGSTRFMLPSSWAGNEKLFESISGLETISAGATLQNTDRPHVKLIEHEPSAELRIGFLVKQKWQGEPSGERYQKYWPNITQDYFHFFGIVLFPYPGGIFGNDIQFQLRWEGFPDSWSFCNSFGSGQREQSFVGSLNRFRRAVYAGGDYRLRTLEIHGQPVTLALRGESWGFTDPDFYNFAAKIISTERDFWQDHDFPYFLITLTPFGTGHSNLGGTGLHQSFSVLISSDSELDLPFKRLLAHELFHSWNAAKLGRLRDPTPELYWFSEGFTDYYTRSLLLRAEMMSLEDYVRDLNAKLTKYFRSPVRNAPLAEAAAGYFTDDNLGALSYQRGDFLALRWNALIKQKTKGQRSLDDLMRGLLASARTGGQIITTDLIRERIEGLCGVDVDADIEKFVLRGDTLTFSGDELGPCFEVEYTGLEPEKAGGEAVRVPQFRLKEGLSFDQPDCLVWLR